MASYKIGELAAAAGVSRDTIRYYERSNLLRPPHRSGAGYRLYDRTDLLRLSFIRSAQRLGFTLAQTRELLDLQTSDSARASAVLSITLEKIRDAESRVNELNRIRNILEDLAAECPRDAPVSDCPILAFISAEQTAHAGRAQKPGPG